MKLIFVYNADSDYLSSIKDAVIKVVAPAKYQCNLCAVTHGAFTMNKEWKEFIKGLGIDVEFLHKDEFNKTHKEFKEFPAVFRKETKLKLLISKNELNSCKSTTCLKELVLHKLKEV